MKLSSFNLLRSLTGKAVVLPDAPPAIAPQPVPDLPDGALISRVQLPPPRVPVWQKIKEQRQSKPAPVRVTTVQLRRTFSAAAISGELLVYRHRSAEVPMEVIAANFPEQPPTEAEFAAPQRTTVAVPMPEHKPGYRLAFVEIQIHPDGHSFYQVMQFPSRRLITRELRSVRQLSDQLILSEAHRSVVENFTGWILGRTPEEWEAFQIEAAQERKRWAEKRRLRVQQYTASKKGVEISPVFNVSGFMSPELEAAMRLLAAPSGKAEIPA